MARLSSMAESDRVGKILVLPRFPRPLAAMELGPLGASAPGGCRDCLLLL